MKKFILKIILFCFLLIPFFELSAKFFMNYNAPFEERKNINLEWENIDEDDNGRLLPNQIIYHANNGKIFKDSIKYKINNYGHRGDSYDLNKEPNETRIIFLGNSNLYDEHFYYSNGGDFTRVISKNLDKNFRVINASIPGATINKLKKIIPNDLVRFNPDIVLISSIWNDIKVITANKQGLIQIDKVENNKLDTFVIGVSGGIDSAVTSALCGQTKKKTIVLTMPIHQNPDETNRGLKHINWLITGESDPGGQGIYDDHFSYILKVVDVRESTVVAKLIELENPWVEVRPGDIILLN